ncbi:unnamed protein product [Lymnaea stagnalis]|uniref:Uncharacterized protein n=1 Tax=Lymnaea stagnalis TaxID=6523 RepID=A0AAV2HAR9_LYMST
MSPTLANCSVVILMYLYLGIYGTASTDVTLKEGEYFNFTCTSNDDRWYVTKNGVSDLVAWCRNQSCVAVHYRYGVQMGSLDNTGTFLSMAVYRNMTNVSCSNKNWNLKITDLIDVYVSSLTANPALILTPSLTVDVGSIVTFRCIGHGPPGTSFIINVNNSMVSMLSSNQVFIGVWSTVDYSMRAEQCDVTFAVYCQAGYDVTTRKTIRVSSLKCPHKGITSMSTIPTDTPVRDPAKLAPSTAMSTITTATADPVRDPAKLVTFTFTANMETEKLQVFPGSDVTFYCSGNGIMGNQLTLYNTTLQNVIFSHNEPYLAYTIRNWKCGTSSVIGCQAGSDVTVAREIIVEASKCQRTVYDESKLIWPMSSTGIILAIGITVAYLSYRVRLVKKRAATNALRHRPENTPSPEAAPYVAHTSASMEHPYHAALSDHGSLPPRYSQVVRDAGKYKMPSAASVFDEPPLYNSLFEEQAPPKYSL